MQTADTAPLWASFTARAITSMTPCALLKVAMPGVAGAAKSWRKTGRACAHTDAACAGSSIWRQAVPSGKWRGSPIHSITISSRKAAHAFAATSGPIPAGSPQQMATAVLVIAKCGCSPLPPTVQEGSPKKHSGAGFATERRRYRGQFPVRSQLLACAHTT